MSLGELEGYRIWEIKDNGVPKELRTGKLYFDLESLDLINKTYAIRIGKRGLQ